MTETTKEPGKATQPTLGSSIVGTSSVRNYSEAKRLVIVPGHAVYVGLENSHSALDKYWIGGFNGESKYYTEHAIAGVNEAGNGSNYLLVFSGGQTREKAGPISEAQSYWTLASQFYWNNKDGLADRSLVEDFARDSFENLAFSIATFSSLTKRMPEDVIIAGWAFKEDRYRMHADTLGLNQGNVHYIKVNNPEGSQGDPTSPFGGALKGEFKTIKDFTENPTGDSGILKQKKDQRDPWLRGDSAYMLYNINELFPMLRNSK